MIRIIQYRDLVALLDSLPPDAKGRLSCEYELRGAGIILLQGRGRKEDRKLVKRALGALPSPSIAGPDTEAAGAAGGRPDGGGQAAGCH